jgi:hypothetical protein
MKRARVIEENVVSKVDKKSNYETMTSSQELEVADKISLPIDSMPTKQLTVRLDSQATICKITNVESKRNKRFALGN